MVSVMNNLAKGGPQTDLEIIGVDFSGARSDNKTWMARCSLDAQELTILGCRPVGRLDLEEILDNLSGATVVALDFPFSVPSPFAQWWLPQCQTMCDLWAAASGMTLEQFTGLRDEFVIFGGEPRRLCDRFYPETYPVLHKVNPNMVPMTFYGMQMLGRLKPKGWAVPPLPALAVTESTLLEVMPGAVLRALGLRRFKGYKNGLDRQRRVELRGRILQDLPCLVGKRCLKLRDLEQFQEACLGSHDCLDAIVAGVAGALWHLNAAAFPGPPEAGSEFQVQMEGWIYTPLTHPNDCH